MSIIFYGYYASDINNDKSHKKKKMILMVRKKSVQWKGGKKDKVEILETEAKTVKENISECR